MAAGILSSVFSTFFFIRILNGRLVHKNCLDVCAWGQLKNKNNVAYPMSLAISWAQYWQFSATYDTFSRKILHFRHFTRKALYFCLKEKAFILRDDCQSE